MILAQAAQTAAHDMGSGQTADLLRLILTAVGAGIVGIAGFIAWVTRTILPAMMTRSERQTKALEDVAASSMALPAVLQAHEISIVTKVSDVVRTETQGTARDLGAGIDSLGENLSRRLSATERAVQDLRAEAIRNGADPERLAPIDSEPPPPPPSVESSSTARSKLRSISGEKTTAAARER